MAPSAAGAWWRGLSVWSVVICGVRIARESTITFALNVISALMRDVMSAASARVTIQISTNKSDLYPKSFILRGKPPDFWPPGGWVFR